MAASMLLEQEPEAWHALVMLDSDLQPTEFVSQHSASHLFLRFDDVEGPQGKRRPPTIMQIAKPLGCRWERTSAGELPCGSGAERGDGLLDCMPGARSRLRRLGASWIRRDTGQTDLSSRSASSYPECPTSWVPSTNRRRQIGHVQLSDHYTGGRTRIRGNGGSGGQGNRSAFVGGERRICSHTWLKSFHPPGRGRNHGISAAAVIMHRRS